MLDYFYGEQAEQFSFYRIPKALFTAERFSGMSMEAKFLYGMLLDRMNLSAKNGWFDGAGRVYIIFTIEEIGKAMGCGEKKAIRMLNELEKKFGLVEKKRQGLGKPNLIYVKNFVSGLSEEQFSSSQKESSGTFRNAVQELSKEQGNNTELKNTYSNNNEPILSSEDGNRWEEQDEYEKYRTYFSKELSMDHLKNESRSHAKLLDNILELLTETVCSKRKTIRIAGEDKSAEAVKAQLMKLNMFHIEYVLECFEKNRSDIRNIRQYLLTMLYNAPMTMDSYYTAQVQHDMASGAL